VVLTNRQIIFERTTDGERVLVAVNADSVPYTAHFDAGCGLAVDLLTGETHDFGGGSELAPYSIAHWKWSGKVKQARRRPRSPPLSRFPLMMQLSGLRKNAASCFYKTVYGLEFPTLCVLIFKDAYKEECMWTNF